MKPPERSRAPGRSQPRWVRPVMGRVVLAASAEAADEASAGIRRGDRVWRETAPAEYAGSCRLAVVPLWPFAFRLIHPALRNAMLTGSGPACTSAGQRSLTSAVAAKTLSVVVPSERGLECLKKDDLIPPAGGGLS